MGRKEIKRVSSIKKCHSIDTFWMKPITNRSYYNYETVIEFRTCDTSCIPKFNWDYNHFTPAFINPMIPVDLQVCQQYRHEKIKGAQEHSQFFIPKPREKHRYCGICRITLLDYLEVHLFGMKHIETDKHRHRLRESRFHQYVLVEADRFANKDHNQQSTMQTDIFPKNSWKYHKMQKLTINNPINFAVHFKKKDRKRKNKVIF